MKKGATTKASGSGYTMDLPLPEDLQKLLPPGSFEVESFIGQGGMGAVYKGVQLPMRRSIAIKILAKGEGDDQFAFEDRFKREAYAMAALTHPHIVQVHDCGDAGDRFLFISMEYVDGGDLGEAIQEGRVSPEAALHLFLQICDGLHAAHQAGFAHRDIKPANIFLTRDGRAKVADFGLAKTLDMHSTFMTRTGLGMGTPDFAAPEQYSPELGVDHRADIYALGAMLYNMLTGHVPRGVFTPASQKAGTDPRIDAIIVKAMSEDRERRYQSVLDMKREIEAVLATPGGASAAAPPAAKPAHITSVPAAKGPVRHAPLPAPAPAAARGTRKGTRQRAPQSATGLLLAALLVIIVGGAAFFFLRRPAAESAASSSSSAPAGSGASAESGPPPASVATAPSSSASLVPESPSPSSSLPSSSSPAPVPSPAPPKPAPSIATAPVKPATPSAPSPPAPVPAADPVSERLAQLESTFHAALERDVTKPFQAAVDTLNKGYIASGLARVRAEAQVRANAADITALDEEKSRLESGASVPTVDAPSTPPALRQVREAYRLSHTRLQADRDRKSAALHESYLRALDSAAGQLASSGNEAGAKRVREKLRSVSLARAELGTRLEVPPVMQSRCSSAERLLRLVENGSSAECEAAVLRALSYLKNQQLSDGSWSSRDKAGLTGLALLCLLGHCETAESPAFGEPVNKGLLYLIETANRNPLGIISANPDNIRATYEHAIATSALAEAFTLARHGGSTPPALRPTLEKAVKLILSHELPEGGWGYGKENAGAAYRRTGAGDPSVTGWHVQALLSARQTSLVFPGLREAMDRAMRYYESLQTDAGGYGRARRSGSYTQWTMTGVAMLALQSRGGVDTVGMKAATKFATDHFRAEPPSAKNWNLYSWYYYTNMFFQNGGPEWETWNDTAMRLVLSRQESNGSWKWPGNGTADDIYPTTLATLMLQASYRHPRWQ